MQRITITLDDELVAELDQLIAAKGYRGRSEAMRDLARAGLQQALLETDGASTCVAALVYVYDPGAREVARRVASHFHEHHDLSAGTMHIPLSHTSGMELAVLKGPTEAVRQLADAVLTERGVRHGRAVIVPAEIDASEHRHDAPHAQTHSHLRTR
jgi:CopG family nickel-responsive transcriptional regulator